MLVGCGHGRGDIGDLRPVEKIVLMYWFCKESSPGENVLNFLDILLKAEKQYETT